MFDRNGREPGHGISQLEQERSIEFDIPVGDRTNPSRRDPIKRPRLGFQETWIRGQRDQHVIQPFFRGFVFDPQFAQKGERTLMTREVYFCSRFAMNCRGCRVGSGSLIAPIRFGIENYIRIVTRIRGVTGQSDNVGGVERRRTSRRNPRRMAVDQVGPSGTNSLPCACALMSIPWYLPVKTCEAGRALFRSPLGIATVVGAVVEQEHAAVALVDSDWDA